MASGQTSNYGLNQWAATDKVLREEFNQDNAKIDTALAQTAQAIRCVKLLDQTLTQSNLTRWDLDVSGINFLQYYKIDLVLERPNLSQGLYMRVNNSTNNSITSLHTNGAGTKIHYFIEFATGNDTLCLFNPITNNGSVHCMYVTHSYSSRSSNCCAALVKWSELKTMNFYCDADESKAVPAGIRVLIYGYKR